MKNLVIIALSAVAFTLPAAAELYTQSGYLSGVEDSNEFSLTAANSVIELTFDYPVGADFWVTVYGMTGNLLGDFQLSQGNVIELSGGGDFTVVVTSEYGGGNWSCEWYDGGTKYYSEKGNLKKTSDVNTFAPNLTSTFVEVTFSYPTGADYWVTVYGMSHNHLGTFRLNDGNVIELSGGGQFYIEVYTKSGTGEWLAEWYDY